MAEQEIFSGAGKTTTFFLTLDKNPCGAVDGGRWLGQSVVPGRASIWAGAEKEKLWSGRAYGRAEN